MSSGAVAVSSGNLLYNLILFGRVLRGLGLDVHPGRLIDLARALECIEIGRKADFYHSARCTLVRRREDLPLFDEAFEMFWRKPVEEWPELDLRALSERRRFRESRFSFERGHEVIRGPSNEVEDEEGREEQPPSLQVAWTYSPMEVLRNKDFSELSGEELEQIRRLMAGLVWKLGTRRTRRKRPGQGPWFDLRRTLRQNLRYGGEPLELARREPRHKPRPLVVIADISGSMERYTRLFMHFIYSLTESLDQQVEAFVFGTRLTRITRQLRGRDVEQALKGVSRHVPDWSGGTRIGEAIKAFNFEWARAVLGRGALVLLISDGWDRGDIDLLQREMARLQRSCYRLIWLNPLLGSPDYEPLTRGIQVALPYVDDFLPVHNLASLEELADRLEGLEEKRPARRQQRA